MMIRFSRFRFKVGTEAEGLAVLRRHTASIVTAVGCEGAWLAQGQHPSNEFVVVAIFQDETFLRTFEGRLRSDPGIGGDLFAAMRLTTQPPEISYYEVRHLA